MSSGGLFYPDRDPGLIWVKSVRRPAVRRAAGLAQLAGRPPTRYKCRMSDAAARTPVRPGLVAHRGYARHYPENTLAGIEAAIRAGARLVEVDVQLSSDGVAVLFHDRSLERVCGVPGAVHDHTLAQLRALRASEFGRFGYRFAQEPIPTLAELAELLGAEREVTAFIELKRASLARFGADAVLACLERDLAPVRRRCIPISFDLPALAAARAGGWPTVGAVIERWAEHRAEALARLQPQWLFCDVEGLPRCGRLRHAGAKLVIYEVDDPSVARRLAARGADYIETFAVGELRAALALRAAAR